MDDFRGAGPRGTGGGYDRTQRARTTLLVVAHVDHSPCSSVAHSWLSTATALMVRVSVDDAMCARDPPRMWLWRVDPLRSRDSPLHGPRKKYAAPSVSARVYFRGVFES